LELSLYRVIRIPKGDGRLRIIHAPNDALKEKQRTYLENERRTGIRFPRRITAFLRKRGIREAAAPHVGKSFVVGIDIKDFFHHVTPGHVLRAMQFDRLLPGEIETRTESLKERDWKRAVPPIGLMDLAFIPSPREPGEYCLPQGSPLSPFLAAWVSKAIDFKIAKMIRNQKIDAVHTIYADGIFVSSDDRRVIPMAIHGVERILASEGFQVNRKKLKVMRRSVSQRVCGVVVNEHLTVPKAKRHEIRGRLHNLYMDAKADKGVDIKEFNYVQGYMAFAGHLDPPWAERLEPQLRYVRLYLFQHTSLPKEE